MNDEDDDDDDDDDDYVVVVVAMSRPSHSFDSHASTTLHRQNAALEQLERENEDLKQSLQSSQTSEQAIKDDLIQSEKTAEQAAVDLERTRQRLEECLDEKVGGDS